MLVSLKWLREYVDLPGDLDVEELATKLTMASSEVEGIHRTGAWDRDLVRVGQVVARECVGAKWIDYKGCCNRRDAVDERNENSASV